MNGVEKQFQQIWCIYAITATASECKNTDNAVLLFHLRQGRYYLYHSDGLIN